MNSALQLHGMVPRTIGHSVAFRGPRPWIDVTAYGADPTGVASSASAFSSALTAAKVVYVPEGTYDLGAGIAPSVSDREIILAKGATIVWDAAAIAINCTGDRVTIRGGTWVPDSASGEFQSAVKFQGDHCRAEDLYVHDTGGAAIYCTGDYPEVINLFAKAVGTASNSAALGSYVGGGVYFNGCAAPIMRGGLVLNTVASGATVSSCTNALIDGVQMIGASGNGGMENGVYELGTSVGTKVVNCTIKNTIVELIQLAGVGRALVSGCTFGQDAAATGSQVGIHCGQSAAGGGSDRTTITGCVFDSTYLEHTLKVGRAGVSVDGVSFTGNTVDGPSSGSTIIEGSSDTEALLIASNVFNGNVKVVANASVNAGTDIRANLWQNVSLSGDVLLSVGKARVSDCEFRDVTLAGVLDRSLTTHRDVSVRGCSITGTSTVTALLYGTDTSMGAGAGDEWYFEDCDFGAITLSANSSGGAALAVASPLRVGNTTKRIQYSVDEAVDGGGSLVFGPFSATASVNPVGIQVEVVGRVANTVEWATVRFVKGNNTASSVSYVAGPNNGSTVFASGEFTATGSGNETLSITYTNPRAAGTICRLTADVLVLLR